MSKGLDEHTFDALFWKFKRLDIRRKRWKEMTEQEQAETHQKMQEAVQVFIFQSELIQLLTICKLIFDHAQLPDEWILVAGIEEDVAYELFTRLENAYRSAV